MATSLQQQLAAINAKSTQQLDLKAQKGRHSQSLLYEPRDAAKQSFETIYQICQEGFAELCQLDKRYAPFSRNLFDESSITVEREHMTATENKQLNLVIDQFLGLLSGRLLLRPAQKCLEWLVRRWRIHEYNTVSMLYAVLPYHGHEMFATVLSILPEKIPGKFSFLQQYKPTLRCPPRQALIVAAVQNDTLISGFSSFVLEASKRKLQSSILVGFWVSILAQSLYARLDDAQSGRDEIRRQRSEDVLLGVLPTLQDMLTISNAPDIYLGACMLMTILATKIDLEDKVLDAFMEGVVRGWSRDTMQDGVECLAVLAEEKSEAKLSDKVWRAISKDDSVPPAILSIGDKIRSDNLIAGLIDASATAQGEAVSITILSQLVEHILAVTTVPNVIKSKLHGLQQSSTTSLPSSLRSQLDQLVGEAPEPEQDDVEMDDANENDDGVSLDGELLSAAQTVSVPSAGSLSFLQPGAAQFDEALEVFERCHHNVAAKRALINRLGSAESHLAAITFLARCWTSSQQAHVRKSAFDLANDIISNKLSDLDLQAIHPYVLVALADSNAQVRRAAAKLALTLANSSSSKLVWAKTSIYGKDSEAINWLSSDLSLKLIQDAVRPRLEECILDQTVLKTGLTAFFNDSDVKSTQRSSLALYLASHALTTSVSSVQTTLLGFVQGFGKSAADARITLLVPFIKQHLGQSTPQITAAIQCLTHRSEDEIKALQAAAESGLAAAYIRLGQIFNHAKPDAQRLLVTRIFSQALSESNDGSADAFQALRSVKLPIDSLTHLLTLTSEKPTSSDRPAKRQRIGKGAIDKPDIQGLDFTLRRASTCLEIVEDALSVNRPTADDKQYAHLVKQLFSLLGDVQAWRSATGSDLTYLQVLTLNNILATLKYSNAKGIDRSCLRTDLIVETLRSTASPQVHNIALLVISKIATFAPDIVLHSVMPLFTFMSSSTLRQVDAYSIHVINMTIESIVPPLRESLKAKGKDLVAGASDLLLSFSAAFEHIPGHRRQDTFVQLLKVLGPEESLYAVLAMLVERYNEDTTLTNSLRSILDASKIEIQLKALSQYLDLVHDACKKRRGLSDSILGFSEKNAAEVNSSVAMLLDGWAKLITSPVLQSRVSNQIRKENAQAMRDAYSVLLGKLVALPHNAGIIVKFDEPTLSSAHDAALQALLALLPTEEFITASADLMQAGSEQVRVKVFASLTSRVNDAKAGDTKVAEIFIETLPNCSVFVSESQPVAVRRAALDCMDAIIEKFGKRNRSAVSDAAKALLSPAALLSDSASLQAASLLCLASSVDVLGEEFVSIAGKVLDISLKLAGNAIEGSAYDAMLVDSVFTLLNSVLDHQAWLISASLLDRALLVASQIQQSDSSTSLMIQQFYQLAPAQVQLRDLVSSLNRTFGDISSLGDKAVLARARMVRTAIIKNTKANVTKNAEPLSTLTLNAFSLRPSSADIEEDVVAAYQLSIDTALDMTLKLNDLTFRPLFMKVVAWADGSQAQSKLQPSKTNRMIVLFDFAQRLFEQLGSIVTSYASFILDHASSVLTGSRDDVEWDALITAVLEALTASFKQDQDDFWSAPQHFDAVAQPLLSLLCKPVMDQEALVNSTIVELAAAVAASSEHLKSINAQIMVALRHRSAGVRLTAVKCERKITERLTFDWLNLLPEMLPYISELLEDDDEEVEREVLGWVAQIEEITGESLEGMLA